jgi:hypothetical protein
MQFAFERDLIEAVGRLHSHRQPFPISYEDYRNPN